MRIPIDGLPLELLSMNRLFLFLAFFGFPSFLHGNSTIIDFGSSNVDLPYLMPKTGYLFLLYLMMLQFEVLQMHI